MSASIWIQIDECRYLEMGRKEVLASIVSYFYLILWNKISKITYNRFFYGQNFRVGHQWLAGEVRTQRLWASVGANHWSGPTLLTAISKQTLPETRLSEWIMRLFLSFRALIHCQSLVSGRVWPFATNSHSWPQGWLSAHWRVSEGLAIQPSLA